MQGRRGRIAAWTAGILVAVMGAAAPVHAAAGDLDPAFSDDGRVTLASRGPFVARAIALQPDGRILVAGASCEPDKASRDGTCLSDGASSFRVARFTPDGGLDPEFGDDGVVTTPVGAGRSQALDVVVLPSGRIVAAGAARDRDGRDVLALAGYDQRGALDREFTNRGTALEALGGDFAAAADIAPGPGDTLLVSGQLDQRLLVARFRADGRL